MDVNFFIVGAAKSGTTSIANYLNQHPGIFIPDVKEPKYFSVESNKFPHKGPGDHVADENVVTDYDQYRALYDNKGDLCCGDASVDYLYFPDVARRINEFNESAKIIIVLRNPVERAYSAYLHLVRDAREDLTFEDALEFEEERVHKNWEFFWRYYDVGLYAKQVRKYMELFSDENVQIYLFDDLLDDKKSLMRNIFRFLGVDDSFDPELTKSYNESGVPRNKIIYTLMNKKNPFKMLIKMLLPRKMLKNIKYRVDKKNLQKTVMDQTTRNMLINKYTDDIRELQDLIGRDLTHWLERN